MTDCQVIHDDALRCFVQWCRINPKKIVEDPEVARNVLEAYVTWEPDPDEQDIWL